ncbi:MAG: hypothetical protein JWP78_614 [Mucilaginibacter sp.]|nr:hypothetical protein [Mucilaginibacter sp.]
MDSTSIELDEFNEVLKQNKYDFRNQDQIPEIARYFNQLNNNKKFLVNFLSDQLKSFHSSAKCDFIAPNAFVLYKKKRYKIRAVIWEPRPNLESLENNIDFEVCHDHNFDLLTAGYFGPGYKTRCYSYNSLQINGTLNERVNMIPEGTFSLSEGELLFYRSKHDIHIQIPPDSLSVSLNCIFNDKVDIPQYQFCEKTHKICRYLHSSKSEFLIRLSGVVGDQNFVDPLFSILNNNGSMHQKAYAAKAITQIVPYERRQVEEIISNFKNPLLQDLFKREELKIGSTYDSTADC